MVQAPARLLRGLPEPVVRLAGDVLAKRRPATVRVPGQYVLGSTRAFFQGRSDLNRRRARRDFDWVSSVRQTADKCEGRALDSWDT